MTLSTGHLNVGGFYKVTPGQAGPVVTEYEKVRQVVQSALPEMDFSVERGRGWGKLVSDKGGSMQAGISGIDIKAEPEFRKVLDVYQCNVDDLALPNALLVFEQQAKKLDLRVGDAVTISSSTSRGGWLFAASST